MDKRIAKRASVIERKRHRWLCLLALIALSCTSNYETTIPNWPVNLELDLTFNDKELQGVGSYKIYTTTNTNPNFSRTGYGGVLVYHSMYGYCAFDIACPYEANQYTRVEVDEDGLYAICPQCHSKFGELIDGVATHHSGPAEHGLKPYSVLVNGDKIYIQN